MHDIFQRVAEICSVDNALGTGLLATLFLAGAAGSIMHCGPMCGAFVLGQVSDRMTRLQPELFCELRRIKIGLLLPYHLGRLTTYSALGATVGWSISILGGSSNWFRYGSAILLGISAIAFLSHAYFAYLPGRSGLKSTAWFARIPIAGLTRKIPRGTAAGEYLLGIALGFLPCGFLYAAILAAAGASNPLTSAVAMLAFGLGTTPLLMMIGVAGQAAGRHWNRAIQKAAPVILMLNAILLLALAWQRIG